MKLRERKKRLEPESQSEPEKSGRSPKKQKEVAKKEDVGPPPQKGAQKSGRTAKKQKVAKKEDVGVPSQKGDHASKSQIEDFIASIEPERQRHDVQELHELISKVAPELGPTLQFKNTLGYGKYHYKYKSGREGEWYKIGIANGKSISLHCCAMLDKKYVLEKYAKDIGKANCGKSCVRFQKLENLNKSVVEELILATAKGDLMT